MTDASPRPLRLAVIGAGMMGRRHVAAAKSCGDVMVVAVVDSDVERAKNAAEIVGCAAATDLSAVKGGIDAAIIAVPTAAHAAIAAPLLRAGTGCLVEKPLAASESQCRDLIGAARDGKSTLQIGHIERFNPAVETLVQSAPAAIQAIAARRMSAASARVTDIDVVSDLMVHDLDVVLALKKAPVRKVTAAGTADHAVALLTFEDGATATLTASRITAGRIRDLDVVSADGFFHVDYIARTITRTQQRGSQADSAALAVTSTDALTAQLADFAACVRVGRRPRVSGEDALAALQLAWKIQAAMGLSVS